MVLGDKAPNVMAEHVGERQVACRHQVMAQFVEISPVTGQGMGSQAALGGQFGQPGIDGCRRGHSTLLVTRAKAADTISPRRSR